MANLIGKTLGPYRIIEQIGLGGMATVYKAYQPAMDRYVALKVLSTHLTQDPTFVKRFQQEAKVIAKLEHLHILPVYDHGEEEGYLYLVMRFIQAGTLKDRLERGPLSLEEARHIVLQVGSALDYAHRLGVVHRDLKPSNVLIDPEGDCYLTDFGIAKMAEGTLGLTGSGVIGTPHYMAPEQGQSVKVDQRADVYAMGVVIYEMVTGKLPFDAETPFAVMMKHISEPLPLPRSVRPDLPEGIERVILKALAKEPADRYQSMGELVAAFDQAVQATPAEVRTATGPSLATPLPTIVEEAGALSTAIVPPPASTSTWQQRVTAQPLWLLAAAGLGLLVLVLAGLILSRVPGRVEISGGQVQVILPTATIEVASPVTPGTAVAGTATPVSVSTLTPTQTLRPTPTPQPAPTLTPTPVTAGQCRIVYERDRDIYVSDCDGSGERRLTDHPAADMFPAWSPDGQRIVFNSERDRQPLPDGSTHDSLYIMSASGSGLTRLTSGDYNDLSPAWAPDGSRIAFHRNCNLMTIAPDGSNLALILPGSSDEVCADSPAWSPDGQWLAFVGWERPEPEYFTVYVINTTGTNLRRLARIAAKFAVTVWSPDGEQIGVRTGGGAGATQYYYLLNADGSGEPVEVHSIPDSWFSWYWPQWGGEAQAAMPTTSSMAEQARAFAEPILAAIADRPPDHQDDFSDPASGWGRGALVSPDGWEEGERGYIDGEYYVSAPPAKLRPQKPDQPMTCAGGHPISQPSFSDMVLEVEGRFVEVEDGNWHVIFHQWHDPATDAGGEYKVMFEPNGHVSIGKLHSIEGHRDLAEMQGLPVQAGFEPNRLQIIAVGPQIAVYVNGEPALFATDPNFDERYKSGSFDLVVCNLADTPMEARWDNLKIWDISDLALSSAEATPTAPCRIAFSEKTGTNINDIYVTDCDSSNLRRLTEGRISTGHEPAWSPDGQRLVFDENQNLEFDTVPAYLYIINADGTNRTQIVAPDGPAEGDFPVWSPDGSRIAWQYGCEIMTIRPDGTDMVTVLSHRELSGAGDPEMCANRPRWSPDSQRFAFTAFPLAAHHDPTIPGPYEYRFYVVNADGTGLTELAAFQLAYPRLGGDADVDVFWLPDGRQVALEVREGERTQRYRMNADGSGEMVEIDSIPESWRPWYWPQWGGGE